MVDVIRNGRGYSMTTKKGDKPLRERTNIRSKEGVDGVDECVVWAKPAVTDGG